MSIVDCQRCVIIPKSKLGGVTKLEGMFFNGWESLLRTVVVGVLAYVSLIVLLRISGMRTLSKMNAFDLSGMLAKRPLSELRSSVRDHQVAAGWCHDFAFQQIQGGKQINKKTNQT